MNNIPEDNEKDLIEKVKMALLGMQRYNWEQGVAAQAMLELGDDQWVVSLTRAKDVIMGRNVFGQKDPAAMVRAILGIVHENDSVKKSRIEYSV